MSGVVLVAGGTALVPLAAAMLRFGVHERRVFFARWGFSHAIRTALAGFVAMLLALALLPTESVLGALYATVLLLATMAAQAAWFVRRLQPEGLLAFGFGRGRTLRSLLCALGAYFCLLPFVVGLERVWPTAMRWLEIEPAASSLIERILALEGAALVQTLAVCVLVAPLLEELVFRGFLQPLLVQNFGERGGIAATSLAFALLHPADAFLPLFGLSCILGAIQVRTQCLPAVWAVHGLHNALVLFVAFRFPEARELLH